ncbi:baseplate wedge initiator [Salmonella phage 21]|nr:baseplate wedge initiator [Salmonella phage 21]
MSSEADPFPIGAKYMDSNPDSQVRRLMLCPVNYPALIM